MKAEELIKLAEVMDYKSRVGPGGKSLNYITARQAQDRLDKVCGISNWKVEYEEHRGELFAGVSIKVDDEWITKWDGGSETKIEGEKGVISDSFKRACVVWGLGRFLYPDSGTPALAPKDITEVDKPKYEDDPNKAWFDDKNYDNIVDLLNQGKTFTIKDIRDKYKVSKVNATKLEQLGIK